MEKIPAVKADADAAFRRKEYKLAISKYDECIQLSEQHKVPDLLHLLYSNRSAAKLALQDYSGALADAQQAVAVDNTWVKGWYRSAKALQGLRKHDLAVQAAETALQLEPHNAQVRSLLKELIELTATMSSSSSRPSETPALTPQQQPMSAAHLHHHPDQDHHHDGQLPWIQINQLRSRSQLHLLPQQLIQGSEYIPSTDGINSNLLLLLHGLGDTPASFTALARRMCLPQTASLALSGPEIVPETDGGRSWFTMYDQDLDWELIQPSRGDDRRIRSLTAAVDMIQQQLLPALAAAAAGFWRPDQIFVLGFSQGGTVALELARRCEGDNKLGGVVAISASLLEEQLWKESQAGSSSGSSSSSDGSGGNQGTDVLITHGDLDQVVSRDIVTRTVKVLQGAGCHVQLKTLKNKAHAMINSADEMRACMEFWAKRLRSRPVDAGFEEVPAAAAAAMRMNSRQPS